MEDLKGLSQLFLVIVTINFGLNLLREGLKELHSYLDKVKDKTESKFDNKLFKIITKVLKVLKVVTYLLQKFIKLSQGNFKIAGASKRKNRDV